VWAKLRRDPVVLICALVCVLLAVPYLVPVFSARQMEIYGESFTEIPLILIGIVACLSGIRRRPNSAERRFWAFIAASLSAWLVVRVLTISVSADVYQRTGFGLVIDTLYVVFYVFIVLALDVRPDEDAKSDSHSALHALRFSGSVIFVFGWLIYFAVIPGSVNPSTYDTWVPSLLLYVFLDVYVLGRLTYLMRAASDAHWRLVYGLLLATVVVWAITDTYEALTYGSVLPYVTAGTALDLVWFPPILTLVVAARLRLITHNAGPAASRRAAFTPETVERVLLSGGLPALFTITFPIVHITLYAFGMADEISRPAREVVVLVLMVVLAAMTIGYQRRLVSDAAQLRREHDRLAEQLRHSQKLQAVGQLVGGIAHDFNNILAVIQANVGLMRDLPSDDGTHATEVDEVAASARRGALLIEKLLGFSRQQRLSVRAVDLAALIRGLEATLRRLLPESIEIKSTIAMDLPAIHGDPGSVEQMVMNCATNSRDAMPAGGLLSIEAEPASLDAAFVKRHGWGEPGEYVRLRIRDDGAGIDASIVERVFEPFFTTKPAGAGTGLGLSMVYGLMKQHRGFVDLASEPMRGTTVDLYFVPAEHDDIPAVMPAEQTIARRGSGTILLVEDEESLRRTGQRVLERAGYVVLVAEHGGDALAILDSSRIDLVISDVVMPRMGGPELLRTARAMGHQVPFLLTSGYSNTAPLDPSVPLLPKPWEVNVLLARVRTMLDTGQVS
jgi:signal transduction histidine kinase/CheY-like chemotaxis protein